MSYPFIDLKKQYEVLGSEIQAAIERVLTGGQYINGPEVRELEAALASYAGVSEVVGCGNGTSSMELVLLALGVGPGDAVFCPTFTFIATAEVISLRGARPVFVDIDPISYNIDLNDLEAKIKAVKTEGEFIPKAIIPVDLFGLLADYEALEALAAKYGLTILEDAAQSFGATSKDGGRAGSFGLVGSTSFFPAKPLGCYGDGGAIFTSDKDLADTLRSTRTHGAGGHRYEHVRLGANSRLDTIQAAILLIKLKAFPQELKERQRVAQHYTELLSNHCQTPLIPEGQQSAWAQYTIRVEASRRDKIVSELKDNGIPTMIYYPKPLHLQPVFAPLGGQLGHFPVAEKAATEVLSLPMHPYLSGSAIEDISQRLKACL